MENYIVLSNGKSIQSVSFTGLGVRVGQRENLDALTDMQMQNPFDGLPSEHWRLAGSRRQ